MIEKKHVKKSVKILAELDKLEVGQSICRIELIRHIWKEYNNWIDDSFRVHYYYTKKMTDKEFKSKFGEITRIK